MRPLLVSGAPGTGKSTTARFLAETTDQAVHIETDHFFRFVTNRLDPSKPESKSQNETIIRAYCNAARTYVDGGYVVIMDGVIGPGVFPIVLDSLGAFDFVLLTAPLPVTLSRMRERPGQASATPSMAERMYPQFSRHVSDLPAHVIETENLSVEEVCEAIRSGQESGRLTITG